MVGLYFKISHYCLPDHFQSTIHADLTLHLPRHTLSCKIAEKQHSNRPCIGNNILIHLLVTEPSRCWYLKGLYVRYWEVDTGPNVFLMSNEVCKLNALLSDPGPLYLPRASSSTLLVCAVSSRVDGDIIEKVGTNTPTLPPWCQIKRHTNFHSKVCWRKLLGRKEVCVMAKSKKKSYSRGHS